MIQHEQATDMGLVWDEPFDVTIVDPKPDVGHDLAEVLRGMGYEVHIEPNLDQARFSLLETHSDFLIVGLARPEDVDIKRLRTMMQALDGTRVMFLVADELASYEELLRQAGAVLVAPRKLNPRQIANMLQVHAELRFLELQNFKLRQMLDGRTAYEGLVGGSLPMRAMYRLLDQISRTDTNVLISGEAGTERVEVARAIHQKSERAIHPVTVVDCEKAKDDPEGKEVFGPRGKGNHPLGPCPHHSMFARAGKGTVVLHNIERMHPGAQQRLLEYLHRPFFQDETAGTPHPVSRLMATTGVNLLAQVEKGEFQRELFYRINILQVRIPPLRERREDIPLLAQHYLRLAIGETGVRQRQPSLVFSSQALLYLFQFDWPGNVDELRETVEGLVDSVEGLKIDVRDLPERMRESSEASAEIRAEIPDHADIPLKEAKKLFETAYFNGLLKRTRGNMTLASRFSRVGRPYLYKKIREYGIKPEEFR